MEGDDQTFRVDFSSEGVSRLRERVKEKLKEFMGDYTDDTLVEYVIVLLKNGRHKDEAKSELDVFLGDDSDSFVSWLWDHLRSNIILYVQSQDTHSDCAPKTNSTAREWAEKTETHYIESDADKRNSNKTSGNNHNREHEQLARNGEGTQVSIPLKSVADNDDSKDEPDLRVVRTKSALSSSQAIQKKRRRTDEEQPRKREVSQSTASAPKRLLQFAVRDAVATKPSNSTVELPPKRLRSVVATTMGDSSLEERPHRIPRTSMSAVIKAMSEAVKDVTKPKSSRNVFDRLGHATDVSNAHGNQEYEIGAEDACGGDHNIEMENFQAAYPPQNDIGMLQEENLSFHDTIMDNNLGYDGKGYGYFNGRGTEAIYRSHTSGVGHTANVRVCRPQKYSGQPAMVPNMSPRIASSISTNTGKTQYHRQREVTDTDDHAIMQGDTMAAKSEGRSMKENSNPTVAFNVKLRTIPKQSLKNQTPIGFDNTGLPMEDTDSRMIFVSNVHFAATKDSLSRHFNKFGDILKVIILTDPATGQPKGAAYIEFMRKEAAELALSLDGTSFMSRILKIVRKTSAQPEAAAAPSMTWPRVARGLPFSVPRFGRVPFPRGTPALYRTRVPIKLGARSLQWKRKGDSSVADSSQRSLTYIRTEQPKANGSSGTA